MAEAVGAGGLRGRRRMRDMKRAQARAVELFAAEGFDPVSVEQVAAAAEVSPVSIYRWFGAKERLVLWDDYDPPLLEAVAAALADNPPLEAVCRGVLAALADVYDADRALVLARTKLIYAEPALRNAADADARSLAAALAQVFASRRSANGSEDVQYGDRVLAAVAVSVLTCAVEAWQHDEGRTPLALFVQQGFDITARQDP